MFKQIVAGALIVFSTAFFLPPLSAYEPVRKLPSVPASPPQKDAQLVFDYLLAEYQSGKRGIDKLELLNDWSIRIMTAEFQIFNEVQKVDPEPMRKMFEQHIARMENLKQQAVLSAREGKISRAELAAARYLHWQATTLVPPPSRDTNDEATSIELPSQKYNPPSKNALVVIVDKEGNVYLDNKKLSQDQLFKRITQLVGKDAKNDGVLIKAAVGCRHKYISDIAKHCNEVGCDVHITIFEDDPKSGIGGE